MIFVYNFLQIILLIATLPLLLLIVISKEKYRTRITGRLGIGLKEKLAGFATGNKKTIWIHSLSVGEVTSALPLVKGLREEMEVCVIFSATTSSGMNIALEKINPHVDLVIPAPIDLLPVIKLFTRLIKPDIFILVETDFWPNWLHCLQQKGIPLMLVNGRISRSSFARYQRLNFFFKNLFRSFSLLSMQTDNDAMQIKKLGAPTERIKTLGNLKYDTFLFSRKNSEQALPSIDVRIPEKNYIWVCGSTHPGEEEMIIAAFANLLQHRNDIFLILAPRDPGRSDEIQKIISNQELESMRRTCPSDPAAPILILDTLGELADCYSLAHVAFIGGSLVNFGGHNPLEAAAYGVPVLFGPYMDDFLEIAHDLQESGGANQVDSATDLKKAVMQMIDDDMFHQQMSKAALDLVNRNCGVIKHHIHEINILLNKG